MKLKFSERIGKTKIKTELLREGLSPETVNILWTLILELLLAFKKEEPEYGEKHSAMTTFFKDLWIFFFKLPIDTMPRIYSQVDSFVAKAYLRKWYFEAEWYDKLNLIEFCFGNEPEIQTACNKQLKKEFSAYRFVDGLIVEINSQEEIVEIENALNISDKYKPAKTHLATALKLISDKKSPDYRNSIKESISAVEALCKIIINGD